MDPEAPQQKGQLETQPTDPAITPAINPVMFLDQEGEQLNEVESPWKNVVIEGKSAKLEFAAKTGMSCAECIGCEECPIAKMRNQQQNQTILEVKPVAAETKKMEQVVPVPIPHFWETPKPKKVTEELPSPKDVAGWPEDMEPPAVKDLIPEARPVVQRVSDAQPQEEAVVESAVEPEESGAEPTEEYEVPVKEQVSAPVLELSEEPAPDPEYEAPVVADRPAIRMYEEPEIEAAQPADEQVSEATISEEPRMVVQQDIQKPDASEPLTAAAPKSPPETPEQITATFVVPAEREESAEPEIETAQVLFDQIARIAQGMPSEFFPKEGESVDESEPEIKNVIVLRSGEKIVKIERQKLLRILSALPTNLQRSVEYKKLVEAVTKIEKSEQKEYTEFAQEELLWQNAGQTQQQSTLWAFYLWAFIREYYLKAPVNMSARSAMVITPNIATV